jgi:hypothetical protein
MGQLPSKTRQLLCPVAALGLVTLIVTGCGGQTRPNALALMRIGDVQTFTHATLEDGDQIKCESGSANAAVTIDSAVWLVGTSVESSSGGGGSDEATVNLTGTPSRDHATLTFACDA